MTTIMRLSDEVIEIILSCSDITIEDVINFRCVCKRFRFVAKHDKFMERKFVQRWPAASTHYEMFKKILQEMFKEDKQKNKKPFIEAGINCSRQLRNYMTHIIYKEYYNKIQFNTNKEISIDGVIRFDDFYLKESYINNSYMNNILTHKNDKNEIKNFFHKLLFIDEVNYLLKQSPESPRRTTHDFIERYCNIKKSHYIRLRVVKQEWNIFRDQPSKMHILEMTAIFFAEFIQAQKFVPYHEITISLHRIVQEVLNCLRRKHSDHRIFSASAETLNYWRDNNIYNSYWNKAEGTQITNALDECMFDKLKFRRIEVENSNLKYLCIDNVLENKCGEQIVLYIIYHSVARRLGLRCDIVKMSDDYFVVIFWKTERATIKEGRCFQIISGVEFPDCLLNQQSRFDEFCLLKFYDTNVINAIQMWNVMKQLIKLSINSYGIIRVHTTDIVKFDSKLCKIHVSILHS